jgi:hypothetical protein
MPSSDPMPFFQKNAPFSGGPGIQRAHSWGELRLIVSEQEDSSKKNEIESLNPNPILSDLPELSSGF